MKASAIRLFSSETVYTPEFAVGERETLGDLVHQLDALGNSNNATFLVSYSIPAESRHFRYARAAQLLDQWSNEEGTYDETVGPKLDKALKDGSIKFRKEPKG